MTAERDLATVMDELRQKLLAVEAMGKKPTAVVLPEWVRAHHDWNLIPDPKSSREDRCFGLPVRFEKDHCYVVCDTS